MRGQRKLPFFIWLGHFALCESRARQLAIHTLTSAWRLTPRWRASVSSASTIQVGKSDVHPLRLLVGPAGCCPVHMRGDVFARFKAAVKFLGRKLLFMIHSVPPLLGGVYSNIKKTPSPFFEEGVLTLGQQGYAKPAFLRPQGRLHSRARGPLR